MTLMMCTARVRLEAVQRNIPAHWTRVYVCMCVPLDGALVKINPISCHLYTPRGSPRGGFNDTRQRHGETLMILPSQN